MTSLVDSHCHLDVQAFNNDREKVLADARDVGVIAIINPGVNLETSRRAIELAEKHPSIFAAVGIHPHDSSTWDQSVAEEIFDLARHPKVLAIGEIGLDFYRDYSPRDRQRKAFEQQLFLASELELPVIIHNREATNETFDILARWVREGGSRQGVMHSYSGGTDWLKKTLDLGFYLGISGPITFPKSKTLHQVAYETPLDRILIETDAPYLTPVPYRGRRNEPAHVQYVAQKIGAIKGLDAARIGEQTTQNVKNIFFENRELF